MVCTPDASGLACIRTAHVATKALPAIITGSAFHKKGREKKKLFYQFALAGEVVPEYLYGKWRGAKSKSKYRYSKSDHSS